MWVIAVVRRRGQQQQPVRPPSKDFGEASARVVVRAEAAEHVVDDEGAEVADVSGGVDGRAAVVEAEDAVGVRRLEFADFARYLLDDPGTSVIAGFVEGFKDIPKFVAVARRAVRATALRPRRDAQARWSRTCDDTV